MPQLEGADPPHPGGIVKAAVPRTVGLDRDAGDRRLVGVTRQVLWELLNGHTWIWVEMAIRLSKAFGSTPEAWHGMQMAYDLWQARGRAGEIAVERFVAA